MKWAVLAVLAILTVGGVVAYTQNHKDAAEYFNAVLRAEQVVETVTDGTATCVVENGNTLCDSNASEPDDVSSIAFALAMARRNPLLGLAGTDPMALRDAVAQLEEVHRTFEIIQTTEEERAATSSLHPLRFLVALAALEERRQTFLATGSKTTMEEYHKAVQHALEVREGDIQRYENALSSFVSKTQRFPGLGGTITTESLLSALAHIRADTVHMRDEHAQRMRCISGEITSCDVAWVTLPKMHRSAGINTQLPDTILAHHALMMEARGEFDATGTFVQLEESACLGALPGQQYFFAETNNHAGQDDFTLRYRGDFFFFSTEGPNTAPSDYESIVEYYRKTFNKRYIPVSPTTFYLCPEIMRDAGRAFAMTRVAAFAREHTTIAPEARTQLLESDVLNESIVYSYLAEALARAPDTATRHRLTELIIMLDQRSGGLEYLVRTIANIFATNARLHTEGLPFDIRMRTLLLSHHAFPSLLNAQTIDVAQLQLRIFNEDDLAAWFEHVRRYTTWDNPPLRTEFISYFRALFELDEYFK